MENAWTPVRLKVKATRELRESGEKQWSIPLCAAGTKCMHAGGPVPSGCHNARKIESYYFQGGLVYAKSRARRARI